MGLFQQRLLRPLRLVGRMLSLLAPVLGGVLVDLT